MSAPHCPSGRTESPAPNGATAGVFRCGSLIYTRKGLTLLFAWLLWGDFCFALMETIVPSILPLKLRALDAPKLQKQCSA